MSQLERKCGDLQSDVKNEMQTMQEQSKNAFDEFQERLTISESNIENVHAQMKMKLQYLRICRQHYSFGSLIAKTQFWISKSILVIMDRGARNRR